MNTRYFVASELVFSSGMTVSSSSVSPGAVEDSRVVATASSVRNRSYRVSASSILMRIAMRISRARWYNFLRRVFHYQNGSRSDLGSNPFNSGTWMTMELTALVVQLIITTYTLTITKDEKPVWPMRLWVCGYAFGCILSLVLLYWRYRLFQLTEHDRVGLSDLEQQQQRSSEDSRSLRLMNKIRTSMELFFAIWFVMGNVWVFDSRFGSFKRAPKLHVLCISLLAWNAISYSFPFILFVLLCCCVPLISNFLGYNMNMGSIDRGASEEQLLSLPSWRYKEIGIDLDLGKSTHDKEIPECCICLSKYRDKEEIRQLPCSHIFHMKCVDQWLRIISCCPLCKQQL